MLDLGHISGCTASLKPRKMHSTRNREMHAAIAQDGPETLRRRFQQMLLFWSMLCVLNQLHF
jgi:hypothetical protein